MLIRAGDFTSCVCGHLIKFDGKNWYHMGHSLSLNCSNPIPKENGLVYLTHKPCKCDSPYRNYGEKVCLNCGGILDFESDTIVFLKDVEKDDVF